MGTPNNAFKPAANVTVNEKGTSAAINVGAAFNDVDVLISDNAVVNVGGDITMTGSITEYPEVSAISFLNSTGSKAKFQEGSHLSNGAFSQRKKGKSGAVSVGYFQNQVDVKIGANATVIAGDDIRLHSKSSIPYTFADWESIGKAWLDGEQFSVGTVQNVLNFNAGIQNAFFTSWAEAVASAQEKATGGMLNALVMNTHRRRSRWQRQRKMPTPDEPDTLTPSACWTTATPSILPSSTPSIFTRTTDTRTATCYGT